MLELQRADYRCALPGRLAELELLWQQVKKGDGAAQALAILERCAHSLAGSGATFGCAEVGNAARALELAVAPLRIGAFDLSAADRIDIDEAIGRLSRSLPDHAGHSDD